MTPSNDARPHKGRPGPSGRGTRATYTDSDVRAILQLIAMGITMASSSTRLGIPYPTVRSFATGRTRGTAFNPEKMR